jgi:hypothetical protein
MQQLYFSHYIYWIPQYTKISKLIKYIFHRGQTCPVATLEVCLSKQTSQMFDSGLYLSQCRLIIQGDGEITVGIC